MGRRSYRGISSFGGWGTIEITSDWPLNLNTSGPWKNFFINVVLHELGHVLGIPHLRTGNLMFPTQEHCNKIGGVCRPSDLTFESFIEFYNPYVYKPSEWSAPYVECLGGRGIFGRMSGGCIPL